jgi:dTDP-glucose 4,6-dehydratase
MKYFVTGGAGFIGSNYVEFLFNNVPNLSGVTIYDSFTYAGKESNFSKFSGNPKLSVIRGDICNFSDLSSAMADHDYVIHFAAESHVDRSIENADIFIKTNILGTFNVLESAKNNNIKTVVHVSTDEVYGSLEFGSANENYPLLPNSPYAASKAASDLLARSYHKTFGLDVRITRSCNNFGKAQYPEKIVPLFVSNLINGKNLPIYGDGMNVREWIHVSDHCRAIQLVLNDGSPGEVYNIGSGYYLNNNDLAEKILVFFSESKEKLNYIKDRKGHDFRYSLDCEKLKNMGFEVRLDFDSALEETIVWYRDNVGIAK